MDREQYLARVAARLGRRRGAPVPPVPRRAAVPGGESLDRDALVQLFAQRLADVQGFAAVVATRAEAQAAAEALMAERGFQALDCPAALRWPAIEPACAGDPRDADFGLSEARWAIAQTGTVVLWHDPGTPRAASLVPPAAGAFVPASAVVPCLGDVAAQIGEAGHALPACITFMSGPSRSMDIGYHSCMGVHGPGDVTVWVIADE